MHLIEPRTWRFEFIGNDVVLRALDCAIYSKGICIKCKILPENTTLQGIVRRFTEGVHKNSNYAYFGIADLLAALRRKDEEITHLKRRGLTQARALVARSSGLEDHKRFMVALATGKVGNVERLVRVGLRHRDGIRGLIQRFDEAALGLYKPKDFSEKDDMRALLLWKLGGNRIASIAHRALGLPSVSTLRTRNKMPPLIVSHAQPTVSQVSSNILACFDGIMDILRSSPILHVNQMLDEVATEKRIRWDDTSNNFLGVCREHGSRVSLAFDTVEDLVELFRALKEEEVHCSAEVRNASAQRHGASNNSINLFIGNHRGVGDYEPRFAHLLCPACDVVRRLQTRVGTGAPGCYRDYVGCSCHHSTRDTPPCCVRILGRRDSTRIISHSPHLQEDSSSNITNSSSASQSCVHGSPRR